MQAANDFVVWVALQPPWQLSHGRARSSASDGCSGCYAAAALPHSPARTAARYCQLFVPRLARGRNCKAEDGATA